MVFPSFFLIHVWPSSLFPAPYISLHFVQVGDRGKGVERKVDRDLAGGWNKLSVSTFCRAILSPVLMLFYCLMSWLDKHYREMFAPALTLHVVEILVRRIAWRIFTENSCLKAINRGPGVSSSPALPPWNNASWNISANSLSDLFYSVLICIFLHLKKRG